MGSENTSHFLLYQALLVTRCSNWITFLYTLY
jgi:hypothetical protein